MARPKQQHLIGMEPVQIDEIEALAVEHQQASDQIEACRATMGDLEFKCGELLQKHKLPSYNLNGVVVVRKSKEQIKIKVNPQQTRKAE